MVTRTEEAARPTHAEAHVVRRPREMLASATLESLALGAGSVAFVITAVVAMIVFKFQEAPISGPGSIGGFIAIVGAVVAICAYLAGWYLVRRRARRSGGGTTVQLSMGTRIADAIDIAAIALAHALIALLGWLMLADVIERAFQDAPVFGLPLVVLSATASAVTAYFVFFSAIHMTPSNLSSVLLVFLVLGALTSMLTASDPHWWKDNLSALGMTNDLSAMAFNLTLIVAGIVVTAIARYATSGLPVDDARGLRLVRGGLIVIGVCLTCVGIFPVDRFFVVHNSVATGMCVVFAAIVIGIRWWIPRIPGAFVALGYIFLAVVAVLAVLFAVGYYTLTAVELVAAILIFSWIILFIRNAGAIEQDSMRKAEIAAAIRMT